MMLSKCYTQYVSKFWKLSSGHRTRKGPFSFQYQRKVKVKSLSHVRLFATSWTVAYQAPPTVGFSRHWSGVSFPSPGDLLNPGIEPGSPALQADAVPSEPPGKLNYISVKLGGKELNTYYLLQNMSPSTRGQIRITLRRTLGFLKIVLLYICINIFREGLKK